MRGRTGGLGPRGVVPGSPACRTAPPLWAGPLPSEGGPTQSQSRCGPARDVWPPDHPVPRLASPPAEVVRKVNELIATGQHGRLFAVVHFASHQWKVTAEDLILIENELDVACGERIRLEKVRLFLCVSGTQSPNVWSLIPGSSLGRFLHVGGNHEGARGQESEWHSRLAASEDGPQLSRVTPHRDSPHGSVRRDAHVHRSPRISLIPTEKCSAAEIIKVPGKDVKSFSSPRLCGKSVEFQLERASDVRPAGRCCVEAVRGWSGDTVLPAVISPTATHGLPCLLRGTSALRLHCLLSSGFRPVFLGYVEH